MAARILIADDIPTNRIGLAATLTAAGYESVEARAGCELALALATHHPEIAIIDSGLSAPGAVEICGRLKADPQTEATQVIFVSADAGPEARLAALRAGADELIGRPVSEQVLLTRIRNLLRTKTLSAEVGQRQKTALDLGFAEAPAAFARPARILVVRGKGRVPAGWAEAQARVPHARVEHVDRADLFKCLNRDGAGPDLVLLPVDANAGAAGLNLVAELRSRPATRHAAIVLAHAPENRLAAISALDFGANDLIETDALGAELRLRLRNQLDLKIKSDQLRNAMENGLQLAVTDPLTGLFNRRYALPHLSRLARHAVETRAPFAVMVLDLDRFKRINDEYGHAAGDAVLVAVADRLRGNLRSVDLVARIGGEEFLVAMPDAGIDAARAAAERLRRVTEAQPIMLPGNQGAISVTLSIGLATAGQSGPHGLSVEELIDRADRALLSAKSQGRNMVDVVQVAA